MSLAAFAQSLPDRQLLNGWELHAEIAAPTAPRSAVKEQLPSFLEYQDLIMFHPKFGYYGSGRVNFSADYQTFLGRQPDAAGRSLVRRSLSPWSPM